MNSSSSDEICARLDVPTPSNHTYWNRDSVYTFDPLTTKSTNGLQHSDSPSHSWDSTPLAILLANPNSNARAYPRIDNKVIISQKILGGHISQSGTVNLNDFDSSDEAALVTHSERSNSPTTSSFSDACSDYEQQSIYDDDHIHKDPDPGGRIKSGSDEEFEDEQSVPPSLTRPTRIRFRSRVRVGSGLSRHQYRYPSTSTGTHFNRDTLRGLSTGGNVGDNYHLLAAPSSTSSSPSSSISMPLRSRADDEADRPGWGPLGRRVSMLANKKTKHKRISLDLDNEDISRKRVGGHLCMNERSPLLYNKSRSRRQGQENQRNKIYYNSDPETSSWNKSPEEMEEEFGKWPQRMFNYRWWWWRTEGVVCCRCLDESDDEYY